MAGKEYLIPDDKTVSNTMRCRGSTSNGSKDFHDLGFVMII